MTMDFNIKKSIILGLIVFYLIHIIDFSSVLNDNNEPFTLTKSDSRLEDKCTPIISNALSTETFLIDNVSYPKYLPMFLNSSYNFTCMNENKKPKVILFWNKLFNRADFKYGIGNFFKRWQCPVWNCETTNNRTRVNESDFIVFSLWDHVDELPKWRRPHQIWINHITESPEYFESDVLKDKPNEGNPDLVRFNGLFNLSWTYRLDSNFTPSYTHHLNIRWKEDEAFDFNKNYLNNKTKFAFQVASHCNSSGKRDVYLKELGKYVQIDIYGKCGQKCPNKMDYWTSTNCKSMLMPQYKFYLSFENSICLDYISEKFYTVLKHDIIPIVYGGGRYDWHVPKSGYINAFDFESPKDLAEYMTKVANNETLYNSYFKWKRYIQYIAYPYHQQICELCIMLNLKQWYGMKHSVIERTDTFWSKKNDCKNLDSNTFQLKKY